MPKNSPAFSQKAQELVAARLKNKFSQQENQNSELLAKDFQAKLKPIDSKINVQAKSIPLLSSLQFDKALAWLGTNSLYFNIATKILKRVRYGSEADKSAPEAKSSGQKILDVAEDATLKARHLAQYTLHARPPEEDNDRMDDIFGDLAHDTTSFGLGRWSYYFNAFVQPHLLWIRAFFPKSSNPIIDLPNRVFKAFDVISSRLTSSFWNLRRFGLALVPHGNKEASSRNEEENTNVRHFLTLVEAVVPHIMWDGLAGIPFGKSLPQGRLRTMLHKNYIDSKEKLQNAIGSGEDKVHKLLNSVWANFKANGKSILTGTYKDPTDPYSPEINLEDYETQEHSKIFLRSKAFSKFIGFFVGPTTFALNTLSSVTGVTGELLNSSTLKQNSQRLTDVATAMMSMIYTSSEVAANIDKFYVSTKQEHRKPDEGWRWRNLRVGTYGVLGMAHRFSKIFQSVPRTNTEGLHSVLAAPFRLIGKVFHKLRLDDPLLEPLFMLFFSDNRLVAHTDEYNNEFENASAHDKRHAAKHEAIVAVDASKSEKFMTGLKNTAMKLSIIPRVLTFDPDVQHINAMKDQCQGIL